MSNIGYREILGALLVGGIMDTAFYIKEKNYNVSSKEILKYYILNPFRSIDIINKGIMYIIDECIIG